MQLSMAREGVCPGKTQGSFNSVCLPLGPLASRLVGIGLREASGVVPLGWGGTKALACVEHSPLLSLFSRTQVLNPRA